MDNLSFEEIKSKFNSNKKFKITSYALGGIILLGLLYFLYRQFIWMPSNEKSNDSWWSGMNFIVKDSTNQAIKALEPVVKKYDGKSGGEISQFLLARQYMEKGQFQKAINNLEGVDVNDTYIRIYSIGLQGDCYSELKKYDTAVEKYLEAADEEDNEFTTPMYLLKAGLCAEKTKDYEVATTYYTRILDDYPSYGSQKTIEKYIARTSTIKKK
jgi:tetratricopeptide (TPR) repeat protein